MTPRGHRDLLLGTSICWLLACGAPPPSPVPPAAPPAHASTQPPPGRPSGDGAEERFAGRVLGFHTLRPPTIAVVLDGPRELELDGSRPDADALFASIVEAWRLAEPVVVRGSGSRIVAIEGVVPPDTKTLPAPQTSGPFAFVDRDVVGSLITQDRGVYPSGGRGVQVTFARRAALYTLSMDAPALPAQLTALAISWWSAAPVAVSDAPGAQIVVVSWTGTAPVAPPPSPPMSIRWSLDFPRFKFHPAESWRLDVRADGTGLWETRGGAVPVGSDPPAGEHCEGRAPPELHRRIVEAGQEAVAVACTRAVAKPGAPTLTVEVHVAGRAASCKVARDAAAGEKLEELRERVTAELCRQ